MSLLLAALCAVQLASAPAADARTPLLVLELQAEPGIEASVARTVTALVSSELSRYRDLNVIADADVKRMLELEGQRQQVGCGDTSCLAELAGALGARLVVFGSIGRLGEKTVVTLNLFDSQRNESVGRQFVEVADVGALSALLPARTRALLERFYADNGLTLPADEAPPPPSVAASTTSPSMLPVVAAGAGGVGVAVGAVLAIVGVQPLIAWQGAKDQFTDDKDANDLESAVDARADAESAAADWNSWGVVLTGVGGGVAVLGAAAIVGGVMGMSE
jgi:TolB-like protein